MRIRHATSEDMPGVATVFMAAFPTTISRLLRWPSSKQAVVDVFAFLHQVEPASFCVAEIDDQLVGYAVTPKGSNQLGWLALRTGWCNRWLKGAVRGCYGLRWSGVPLLLIDQLIMWLAGMGTGDSARVLSIAVHPQQQGRGVGKALLNQGLDYLQRICARRVRLEVHVDNQSGRALYVNAGFMVTGQLRNTQGRWLIMSKQLSI